MDGWIDEKKATYYFLKQTDFFFFLGHNQFYLFNLATSRVLFDRDNGTR